MPTSDAIVVVTVGLCLLMPLTVLATWIGDWIASLRRAAPPELSICWGCGIHLNSREESLAHFREPSCLTTL